MDELDSPNLSGILEAAEEESPGLPEKYDIVRKVEFDKFVWFLIRNQDQVADYTWWKLEELAKFGVQISEDLDDPLIREMRDILGLKPTDDIFGALAALLGP